MKQVFLYCTRLRYFWVEIPIVIIFWLSYLFNDYAETALKLYPLMITSGLAFLFVIIYYFRAISISYEEIKYIGWFSSRDSAMINEGKTLIITKEKGRKIRIVLFGNDGVNPEFEWMKSLDGKSAPKDIILFRGYTYGTDAKITRILRYFGAESEKITKLLDEDAAFEFENTSIRSTLNEDNNKEIHIRINNTV